VKRILVLLSVVALMVVMLAMSIAPAFAALNAEGCRGVDGLVPVQTDLQARIDGKKTADNQTCVRLVGGNGGNPHLQYYDNG
jgi:hypothetical protein